MTFQENLSRPGIFDAIARYRAAARRLRNTAVYGQAAHGRTNVMPSLDVHFTDSVRRAIKITILGRVWT